MSGGLKSMSLAESDVRKMLSATTHHGSESVSYQMKKYVFQRRPDGVHIINLSYTWEKLLLAARAIAAVQQPSEIFAISSRPFGHRAVLKFASFTGSTAIAGRFIPGTFTNHSQKHFREPTLLIVSDPSTDRQSISEASYANIPVIAFCNTNSPLKFVDIAIPCNTNSYFSVGLMWWMLAREVLRLRGSISRDTPWDVMADLFFFHEPEEDKDEKKTSAVPIISASKVKALAVDDGWDDAEPTIQAGTEAKPSKIADDWNDDATVGDWGTVNSAT